MTTKFRFIIQTNFINGTTNVDSIDMDTEKEELTLTKEIVDGEITEKLHKIFTNICVEKIATQDKEELKERLKLTFTVKVLGWSKFE